MGQWPTHEVAQRQRGLFEDRGRRRIKYRHHESKLVGDKGGTAGARAGIPLRWADEGILDHDHGAIREPATERHACLKGPRLAPRDITDDRLNAPGACFSDEIRVPHELEEFVETAVTEIDGPG